jgi:hypothetical protein
MSDRAYEHETIINCDDSSTFRSSDGESMAEIWSSAPAFQRRMAKLGIAAYRVDHRANGQSSWYRVPKNYIQIRKPTRHDLSPEQRAERAERAKINFGHPSHASSESPGSDAPQ